MFSRPLDALPPWTDQGMFDYVTACSFSEPGTRDFSMFATARALLERRVSEPFDIKIANLPRVSDAIENPIDAINAAFAGIGVYESDPLNGIKNKIIILQYLVDYPEDAVDQLFSALDAKFSEAFSGWEHPQKSETFLNQYMKIRVFLNKESNVALLFTEQLTMSKWHLIQAVLPTYVPNLFKEMPLDENEKHMLHALTGRNVSNYMRELAHLEEKYDFRSKKINAMIGDFEIRERRNQLRSIDNELQRCRTNMLNKMEEYKALLRQQDELNIRRNGMAYAIDNADDGSDLISYFQSHKMLDLVRQYVMTSSL